MYAHGGIVVEGSYKFTFFNIALETQLPPRSAIEGDGFATISHEYIHFIQNTSTVFGLAHMCSVFDQIKTFYHAPKGASVPVPFVLESESAQLNKDLFSVYFNRVKYVSIPCKDFLALRVEEEEPVLDEFPDLTSFRLIASVSGNETEFSFGADAIIEGMAISFENSLFSASTGTVEIPYDLPRVVVGLEHPDFPRDSPFIFAVCDASLSFYDPATVFLNSIRSMAKAKSVPAKAADVYEFIYKRFVNPRISRTYFHHHFDQAKSQISGVVNAAAFQESRDWIVGILNEFESLRASDHGFLASILERPRGEALEKFAALMRLTGTPLIHNSKGESFVIAANGAAVHPNSLFYWIALGRVFEQITASGGVRCPVQELCADRAAVCDVRPWDREPQPGHLCMFNQIYSCLGLSGKQLTEAKT